MRMHLVMIASLTAIGIAAAGCSQHHEYEDTEKGFSISFPEAWEPRENASAYDVLYEQKGEEDARPSVGVAIRLIEGTDLENAADKYIEELRKGTAGFAVNDRKACEVAGEAGLRVVCSHTLDERGVKTVTFIGLRDGKACYVHATSSSEAFAENEATFDEIAASFQWS